MTSLWRHVAFVKLVFFAKTPILYGLFNFLGQQLSQSLNDSSHDGKPLTFVIVSYDIAKQLILRQKTRLYLNFYVGNPRLGEGR